MSREMMSSNHNILHSARQICFDALTIRCCDAAIEHTSRQRAAQKSILKKFFIKLSLDGARSLLMGELQIQLSQT